MLYDYIDKHVLVAEKEVTSLIKAEWRAIRNNNEFIISPETSPPSLFSNTCCGILFLGHHSLASNGHWLMHAVTDGPSLDYNVSHFFYDYIENEVYENIDPFYEEGVDIRAMFDLLDLESRFNMFINPQDIKDFIEQLVPAIQDRRSTVFMLHALSGTDIVNVSLTFRDNTVIHDRIRVPGIIKSKFPKFTVNCSYMYKIACVLNMFNTVIEMSTNQTGAPIVFRVPSSIIDQPIMTIILGQYML